MKRFWPLVLIAAGLCLLFGGFIYDVMFAGIPYQDPTPEMSVRYANHARIASVICWFGVGALLSGVLRESLVLWSDDFGDVRFHEYAG